VNERLRLWLERAPDGYFLRDAASGEIVKWSDPRFHVVPVAGASYRLDALQDDAFAPGRQVTLVREPDNPHDPNAVAIWDEARRLQAGYVPAELAPQLRGDEQAVALREFRDGGRRVGLRVLIAPADAWIQEPRR
jgi:HIRAN domain-containing protein